MNVVHYGQANGRLHPRITVPSRDTRFCSSASVLQSEGFVPYSCSNFSLFWGISLEQQALELLSLSQFAEWVKKIVLTTQQKL